MGGRIFQIGDGIGHEDYVEKWSAFSRGYPLLPKKAENLMTQEMLMLTHMFRP